MLNDVVSVHDSLRMSCIRHPSAFSFLLFSVRLSMGLVNTFTVRFYEPQNTLK